MTTGQRQFPCKNCGANLQFAPGTTALVCPYCGTLNEIAAAEGRVEELDFNTHLTQLAEADVGVEVMLVHCNACGAETTLGANVTAGRCPFCASPVVAASAQSSPTTH